jgi:hypothetical protein
MKNGTRKKANSAPAAPAPRDLRDEIGKRAYEIGQNEGGGHGSDVVHWLRAERELAGPPSGPKKEASPN